MKKKTSKNETILFIGDSITDCGRRGQNAPLGDGFCKMTAELFAIRQPAREIRFINRGIGGNTTVDLQERWTDDALILKPDVMVLMIGINDLCRTVVQAATAVPPEKFAAIYDSLMARTAEALPRCRVILLEPFYITREEAHTSIRHTVLSRLPPYIRTVHAMSRKYKTTLVKTHEMFQKLIRYQRPDVFCPEPVHPNHTGHLAMAEAVYAQLAK